jgi:hypothetical protein
MKVHHLSFGGAVLERGFWLYVWRVSCGPHLFLYVGRTGDSSSKFAASPFARIGQHLDIRPKASANMLLRHIRKRGLDPQRCNFKFISIGPVFSEQKTLQAHRHHRDRIAPMEAALAEYLRTKGHDVCGSHSSKHPLDRNLFGQVLRKLDGVV